MSENEQVLAEAGKESRPPKVLLVFAPQWSPQNPHYSLRAIMGHLRHQGIQVAVRDLNIEFYDTVLSPDYMRMTANKVRLAHRYLGHMSTLRMLSGDDSLDARMDALRFGAIKTYMEEKEYLLDELPRIILDAKETLKDPRRFYNPDLLVDAFRTIDWAMELISLPYVPAYLSFNYFEQPDCRLNVESLISHATDKKGNLYYEFFEDQVEGLLAEGADYIGISINAFSQVVPGLTLAYLLKSAAPEGCHVGIGGNFFARVKDVLAERPEFFRTFAHSLACGEGEHQVSLMARALHEGRSLETVPNLLYLSEDGSTVHVTPEAEAPQMNDIGIQDLDGLPLDKYMTPELVLTIQASKGCYWGQCTFCDTDFGIRVDQKSIDRLVAEMEHLRDRYGVKHFQFVDEAIRPVYMRRMAQAFIDKKLDVHWFCNGRLEKAITPDMLQLLHDSGLRMVLWGFESGSDRILELIKKGIDGDKRYDILRASNHAGIWNFAYIFFGFPSETREEALSTIEAICQNTDIIHSYGRSVFTLGKQTPLFLEAAAHGIVDVMEDLEELSTNLHYRTTLGMTNTELSEVLKQCTQSCSEAYGYGLWFFLRYRENIHLYVAKYGLEFVKDYKMGRYIIPKTCEEVF